MRVAEAHWIAQAIGKLSDFQIQPCLNLGSSTGAFRKRKQPHIDQLVFEPLRKRNVRVYHVDLKQAEGVDLAGDIFSSAFQQELVRLKPGLTLLSNVLEHVTDRGALVAACGLIVPARHFLLVTVPYSYPFHADPIDTGFRPSPEQLIELFRDFECVDSQVITDTSYWREILDSHSGINLAVFATRLGLRLLMPFYRPAAWRSSMHRWMWLWRPFKVSAILLRKNDIAKMNLGSVPIGADEALERKAVDERSACHHAEAEGVVEFAIRQQARIGRDNRTSKLERQSAVEVEPERTIN